MISVMLEETLVNKANLKQNYPQRWSVWQMHLNL